VLIAIPGPPVIDDDSAAEIRDLMAKGLRGHAVADDRRLCHKAYEELSARGVEFVEPPEARPYGIDASFRDLSGNNVGLTQVHDDLK
jgi:hypothetical protein